MADMMNIKKLALDLRHNRVEKYSNADAEKTLRAALIEANGGKTEMNYKEYAHGEHPEVFAILEELLDVVVGDSLQNNPFFNQMVEYRSVPLGDEIRFRIRRGNLYRVAEISEGNQAIRRQRIEQDTYMEIAPKIYGVKIYEELARLLANRVDFNEMIDDVSKSFAQQLLNDVYALWMSMTADMFGGAAYFHNAAGSFSDDKLLEIIAHVEAATGKEATVVGTKAALRKLAPNLNSIDKNNDVYHMGYCGSYFGSNVVALPQRHIVGTTQFLLPDNVISVVATDAKPIKCVEYGDSIIKLGNPLDNADLTQEFTHIKRTGLAIVTTGENEGIGRYEFTA